MKPTNARIPLYAVAQVAGSAEYPDLHGKVIFQQKQQGVLVTAQIYGLPYEDDCHPGVFAFHVHNGGSCTGNAEDPFADANGHYNPRGCLHPYHAGDLPPLFGNHGYAYMSVLTDRFTVKDILNRVVIIHKNMDDFSTQPTGNAGAKIACGKILAVRI